MERLSFTRNNALKEVLSRKKQIFNFLNMYSLYLFNNNELFAESVCNSNNLNFPDGTFISWKLGIKKQRGPTFTRSILFSEIIKNKKLFFIGIEKKDLKKISDKFEILVKNLYSYNPPYIKGLVFSKEEQNKIVNEINKNKIDYVFSAIGNPKQEILSNQIFKKIDVDKIFNIGAAMDFILNKKGEVPIVFNKLGIEWFYRLITDFGHSRGKVWGSFLGLKYLGGIRLG